MDRDNALAALLLVSLVLVSGCTGGTVSAEEIRDDSLSAMQELDSFRFQQEMNMQVESGGGLSEGSTRIEATNNGSVDVEDRKLHMTQTQDAGLGSSTTEAYLLNDTMYIKILEAESGVLGDGGAGMDLVDSWIKFELPGEFSRVWETQNYMERQEEILNISDVSYSEDATVEGVETYVLSVDPDPDEYEEIAFQQVSGDAGIGDSGLGLGGAGSLSDSVEIHNVSVRQWIAKESRLPVRSSVEFSMTVTSSSAFGGMRSTTVNGSVVTTFTEHNEEVSIELPEAAEDARSFQELMREALSDVTNQTDGEFGDMDRNTTGLRNRSGEISEEEVGDGFSTEG